MNALAEYERRLATALEECITVWNRAHKDNRHVYLEEVAHIGDLIRGVSARVPWVEVDVAPIQGPPAILRPQCPHYWGQIDNRCQLDEHHDGDHRFFKGETAS
jgi:hypothetical protein